MQHGLLQSFHTIQYFTRFISSQLLEEQYFRKVIAHKNTQRSFLSQNLSSYYIINYKVNAITMRSYGFIIIDIIIFMQNNNVFFIVIKRKIQNVYCIYKNLTFVF